MKIYISFSLKEKW